MFEITVQSRFSAAHRVVDYQGNCARVHGHNWDVDITLQAHELDEIGISLDFREAKTTLKAVLDEMDHTDLNEHPAFQDINPTSETLARYLYQRLGNKLNTDRVTLVRVTVSEAPGTSASYFE